MSSIGTTISVSCVRTRIRFYLSHSSSVELFVHSAEHYHKNFEMAGRYLDERVDRANYSLYMSNYLLLIFRER